MASSVLYTGKTGPAQAVTTQTTSNARRATFDFDASVLTVVTESGAIREYDLKNTTTLSGTAASGAITLSVTQ